MDRVLSDERLAELRALQQKRIEGRGGVPEVKDLLKALDALVEQQRIANLIALDESWRGETGDALMRTLRDDLGYVIGSELNPEIAAALGITTGDEDE